jgi:hypothetical protein
MLVTYGKKLFLINHTSQPGGPSPFSCFALLFTIFPTIFCGRETILSIRNLRMQCGGNKETSTNTGPKTCSLPTECKPMKVLSLKITLLASIFARKSSVLMIILPRVWVWLYRKSRHYFADSGGRSVGIVRLRTKATEFSFSLWVWL